MKRLISVIIPVYNERENILLLHENLCALELELKKEFDFEFIFVDDGSNDGSATILNILSNNVKNVKLVKFINNYGQSAAISAGTKHARGEIIVTIDKSGMTRGGSRKD